MSSPFNTSFSNTPKPVKWLLIAIGALSFLATQVKSFFGFISPYQLFGISTWGLKHGMVWQLLTFGMLGPAHETLSLSFILSLFFNLYVLYFVSVSISQIKGLKDYAALIFGGLLVTGASIAATQGLMNYPFMYSSTSPIVYLALTAWMMMDPEREVLLFFALRIKMKWLILIFFGSQIFIEFAQGHFIPFLGLFIPCLYSWAFCVMKWKLLSPARWLHGLERALMRLSSRLEPAHTKVYDFETGKQVDRDAEFVDICLEKISKEGKGSISWREKWRLRRISKRKNR